jgi:hypothetical protein
MKHLIRTAIVATALVASGSAAAKTNPRVGAAMYPTKPSSRTVSSKDHTTPVAAVKANGGTATYTTVQRGMLSFMKAGSGWMIVDGRATRSGSPSPTPCSRTA